MLLLTTLLLLVRTLTLQWKRSFPYPPSWPLRLSGLKTKPRWLQRREHLLPNFQPERPRPPRSLRGFRFLIGGGVPLFLAAGPLSRFHRMLAEAQ